MWEGLHIALSHLIFIIILFQDGSYYCLSSTDEETEVQEGEHICQAHKWQNRFHPPNYTLNHQNCRPRACGLSCWVFKWKWGCLGGEPWRRRACHRRPAETGLPLPLSPQFRSALPLQAPPPRISLFLGHSARTAASAPLPTRFPPPFTAPFVSCTLPLTLQSPAQISLL